MVDVVRSSLGLIAGAGTLTRERAVALARTLVSGGGATAEQVTSLADDLMTTSRTNREALVGVVRLEVERALGRLGLATAEDVRELAARLAAIEDTARRARSRGTQVRPMQSPAAQSRPAPPLPASPPKPPTSP